MSKTNIVFFTLGMNPQELETTMDQIPMHIFYDLAALKELAKDSDKSLFEIVKDNIDNTNAWWSGEPKYTFIPYDSELVNAFVESGREISILLPYHPADKETDVLEWVHDTLDVWGYLFAEGMHDKAVELVRNSIEESEKLAEKSDTVSLYLVNSVLDFLREYGMMIR